MSTPGDGSSIISELTELIVVANAGNGSFVVQTDSVPALYIDKDAHIGINTLQPSAQLEVVSNEGSCLKLRYADTDSVASLNMTSEGDMQINTGSSSNNIKSNASLDLINHNGNTVGLKLAGNLVRATAEELNFTTVTPGTASASKALVVNSARSISGIASLSASSLSGVLQTAEQPNITAIGTLTNLTVSNNVAADKLTGTLQTGAQPNITQVGTLSSLNVSNGVSASTLSGTIQTAAQPNITSIGNLSSVSIAGSSISSEVAFLAGAVAGAASNSKVLVLSSSGSIGGIQSLSATELSGTLQAGPQPNITSVGTLSNLNVTNNVVAARLTGQLQTAAQPNITSIGPLTSVSVAGSVIGSEAAFLSDVVAGMAANSKVLVLSGTGSITGITSLTATRLNGEIQTAAQPLITSVGNLNSVSISGNVISSESAYLSGAVPGTAANSKVMVLNSNGSISGISSLAASNLTGTIQTTAQPFITSVGTLGSLEVSGSTKFTSVSDSSSSTTGAVAISGGVGIEKKLYVGAGIFGQLQTAAQPNITSVGALDDLSVVGDLNVSGKIMIDGVEIGTGGGGGVSAPAYVLDITAGQAASGKALVLNDSKTITGITSLSATRLSGEIQTASQPKITSIGALASIRIAGALIGSEAAFLSEAVAGSAANSKALVLSSSGSISGINSLSATQLSGELQTAAQPKITSVGQLTSVNIAGHDISSEAGFLAGAVAGEAANSKALVLSSNGSISGIADLSATRINGVLQTAAQPNITSVGTLSELTVAGTLTVDNLVTLNGSSLDSAPEYVLGINPGTVIPSKAIVVDANKDVSGVRNFTIAGNATIDNPQISLYSSAINWVGRTVPLSNWTDVCWSPELSLFVAISNSGTDRVMTSSDGINWTVRAAPATVIWNAVCWSPEKSLFVVTGVSSVMTSSDGMEWTVRSAIADPNSWYDVCWSPQKGLFVAVSLTTGTVNRIMTSVDGINWLPRTIPGDLGLTSICWSPELSIFVAVARSGPNLVITSSDGFTWTAASASQANSWMSVCWSPELSLFVAVANDGTNRVMTSPNGTTWTNSPVITVGTPQFVNVMWGEAAGVFVAVGTDYLATSPDGIVWTRRTTVGGSSAYWEATCWSPEKSLFVTVTYSTSQRVMTYQAPISSNSCSTSLSTGNFSSSLSSPLSRVNHFINKRLVSSLDSSGLTLYGNISIGTSTVDQTKLGYIDVSPGTATASKALVVDTSRSITNVGNITATGTVSSTSISCSASISTTNGNVISTNGNIISTNGNITATNGTVSAGTIRVGTTNITAASIGYVSDVTPGTVSASKAVIASPTLDISGFKDITATGTMTAVNITVGATPITATTAGYINGANPGTVVASKAVVASSMLDVSGFRNITATGEVSTGTLKVNGTILDTSGLGYVSGVTPGVATGSKALIVDSAKSISGLTDITSSGVVSLARKKYNYSESISWVSRHDGLRGWRDVAWSPQLRLFVAVARSESANNSIMTSQDGNTWTPRNSLSTGGRVIWVAELGYFVATCAFNFTTILTSINGIDWEFHTSNLGTNNPLTICWSPEKALFVAATGLGTATSTNGKTWTGYTARISLQNSTSTNENIRDICWSAEKGLFVGVMSPVAGQQSSELACTSPDGVTWTLRSTPYLNIAWNSVTWSPQLGLFVAVGQWHGVGTYPQRRIMTSTDGTTWVGSTFVETNSTGIWHDVCWAAELNVFIVVGQSHPDGKQILVSPNGNDWTRVAPPQNNSWRAVCWAPEIGTFASVAETGTNRVMTYTASFTNATYSTKIDSDSPVRIGTYLNNQLVASVEESKLTVNGNLTASTITIGSTPIDAATIGSISGVTAGTASASKVLVVDADRNITNIGSITASAITIGSTPIDTSAFDYLSLVTPGSVAASKAIIANGDKDVAGFRNLSVDGEVSTATLKVNGTSINPTNLAYLDGVTPGAATESKALIVNGDKDITGLRNLTATGDITAASVTIGTTPISTTSLGYLDAITLGSASASKALVVDADRNISNLGSLTASAITIGSTPISTVALGYLDGITAGTASASKALVVDADRNISNLGSLTASSITIGTTPISTVALGYLDGITAGTAAESKALVVDGNKDITGLRNLSASTLTLGSVAIDASELAAIDGFTSGSASASKALVVDADRNISNINSLASTLVRSSKIAAEAGFVGQWSATEYYGIGAHDTETNRLRIGVSDASGAWTGTYPMIYSGSFTSVSDHRIKDDVVPLPYGLADLKKLRPVKYKIKDEDQIGFIAHEVQEVIPEVVHGVKDQVDENGNAVHQGVAYSYLTSLLVKAVQEQSEMIAQLRRELDELKKN